MMYYDRKWIPVCSESINQLEVNVACRELGYEAGDQEIMDSTDNSMRTHALYYNHFLIKTQLCILMETAQEKNFYSSNVPLMDIKKTLNTLL